MPLRKLERVSKMSPDQSAVHVMGALSSSKKKKRKGRLTKLK